MKTKEAFDSIGARPKLNVRIDDSFPFLLLFSSPTSSVDGMAPLVLLWAVTGIGSVLGWQTGFALNPGEYSKCVDSEMDWLDS